MRILREEIRASQSRYMETLAQAELRYQEKMKVMEEELQLNREAERAVEEVKPEGTYTLVDEMLSDLRRRNPEWEIRRQKVLRVSCFCVVLQACYRTERLILLWGTQATNGTDEQQSVYHVAAVMTEGEAVIILCVISPLLLCLVSTLFGYLTELCSVFTASVVYYPDMPLDSISIHTYS